MWLEERLADAPASLRERVLGAVRRHAGAGRSGGGEQSSPRAVFPNTMRDVADALLEDAKSGPPDHKTALTLLAADALVTFWCEALAAQNPEALAELK